MAQALKADITIFGGLPAIKYIPGCIRLIPRANGIAYLWVGHKGLGGQCLALVHEKQTELLYQQLHKIYGKEEPQ